MFTLEIITGILAIVFLAVFISSTFGFGDAMVSMPLLTLLIGLESTRPLVALMSATVSLLVIARDWQQVQIRSILPLLGTAMLAIPLGLYCANTLDARLVKSILAILIISFSIYNLLKPRLVELKNERWGFLFGALSGVFGGAYNIAGPPVVMYASLRRWSPNIVRVTLQSFFFPLAVSTSIGHLMEGNYTNTVFNYYLLCIPIVVVAVMLGRKVNQQLRQPERFHKLIHGLMLVLGITLLC